MSNCGGGSEAALLTTPPSHHHLISSHQFNHPDNSVANTTPHTAASKLAGLSTAGMVSQSRAKSISGGAIRPAPSEVCYKNMRFLITDRPNDSNIAQFIEELKKHKVQDVVRVCEPTYNTDVLERDGIRVMDWYFDDGSPPPSQVVDDWFDLLRARFKEDPNCCVAVHCVAGLGRAPVLVALALIELGMRYEDAVELIRQKRRGAINSKQLAYLEKYRPKARLRLKNGQKQCCIQ